MGSSVEATEVDVLDNKQVGACLAKINNQIIKMRFAVKKGKAWALKELYRKIRKIKTEDTKKEDRKTIKNRKMVRLEEEVAAIKALDCDAIALYALERVREEDLVKVMGSDPPMDRRAKARVAHTKNVKDVVDGFAVAFPEYTKYITLFAARKEKGVGARKHAKGKKKTQNSVETDKNSLQTNDKQRHMKGKESHDESSFVSSEEKEKAAGAKKNPANSTLVTLAQKDDILAQKDYIRDKNFSNEGEGREFAPAEKSISTSKDALSNEKPRVTNSLDEMDENYGDDNTADGSEASDDDSDAIEFERQISSDDEIDEINRDYDDGDVSEDGNDSDDGESDDDLSGDEDDLEDEERTVKRGKKSVKQNANPKSNVPPRPPNRSMVVTRLNLEAADSDFVKVDTQAKFIEERGREDDDEDEETDTPSHSVDPFFAGGSSSSAIKRKLEEEEIDEEDFEDRFSDNDDADDDRDDKGGGDLTSAFVGLRGNSSDSRGRGRGRGDAKRGRVDFRGGGRGGDRGGRGGDRGGRGGDRGGRGGDRGGRGGERGGGRGFGRGRGDFGRGGGFSRGRGDFNRGTDRGRGSFDRGGRGRGRGAFENPKPPPMDETNLHPSWQAKRKQKVQIGATLSQAGKKITFDD